MAPSGRKRPQAATTFILLCILSSFCICKAQFKPADSYLVDCGSSKSTTVGQRTFTSDGASPVKVSTSQEILAGTSANGVASFDNSALYQTARIFTSPSSYTFPIQKQGRHFVRLYFFPFTYQSYDLSLAKFTVSTQDVLLLSDFQQPDKTAPLFKEYSLNITRDTLVISFKPSNGIAFINAIEVVSVPDDLIIDIAQMVNPVQQYSGLSTQPLETVYRVNMGGPKVTPDNDTLSRTWITDKKYLLNPTVTKTVDGKDVNYKKGGATRLTAPDIVYGTAAELAASNTSNALFNMTWQFDVDAGFSYLIRFHFCDIVSKALNQLYFNAYVGGFSAQNNLDLSVMSDNQLATAIYIDVVLSSNDASSKLGISIGPSTLDNVLPDGILNGLEVMKISTGGSAFTVGSGGGNKNLGVILGAVLGAVGLLIIIVVLVLLCRKKKTLEKQHSKTWMPFSINGLTSLSTGSRTSYGTTLTSGLNGSYGYRFAFSVLQEATNNFDENWVIGVGGFGKVYKGVLRDDTKVAVKRGNPKSQQVIDPTLPREMVNLAEWGMKWQKRGELHQIVDQRISGTIRPDSLRKFGETVEKCLADYGVERPSMGDVLWNLEYVLQLQDADATVSDVNSMNRIVELPSQVQNVGNLESISVTMAEAGASNEPDHDLSDVSMSRVFSQLIKAEGR
ncbi:receptor-like protein kinase HERK 1 [Panicum miliaceum]|uniref:Receptor-like protein kinase HERK 1 n=1 Tax=Panicum miliaceum TaxID=4540 RepID=A0A3L6SYF3_PANMI|nr:receptor-like protein kinase HERK 1 [Panicum miliaceum]